MPSLPLRQALVLASFAFVPSVVLGQQPERSPHAGMLRTPDVSATQIAFVYANDLWVVARDGGLAVPLASPPGPESTPRFSPDGQSIAFVGNYEGNRDLYVIPVAGGAALRVTHHPDGEQLYDWTAQGELLFSSAGFSDLGRKSQLFRVGPQGGLPTPLPVPYGANASLSADGRWLAYTPHSHDGRTWKRYRGGMATDVLLFDLQAQTAEKITDWEGTDSQPMWNGSELWYLSDAGTEHRLNLFRYDPRTKQREQITRYADYDVKWPAMGPGTNGKGEIVFQLGKDLVLLDCATKATRVVKISIPGDRATLRPQSYDAAETIQGWDLSPSAKRVVVEARGDIWTLPAKDGPPRNLTRTPGIADRAPAWSPDGKWVAYFSDRDGEYDLCVTLADGKGETKKLAELGPGFRSSTVWSPDSKHIAYTDQAWTLWVHTLDGATRAVDANPAFAQPQFDWAPDSRWIAYSRAHEASQQSTLWIWSVESGETKRVTSGMFADARPVFDRKGEWLYHLSDRAFNATYSSLDTTFIYGGSEVVMAVPLRKDVKLPWAPKSDEEGGPEAEKKDGDKKDGDAAEKKPEGGKPAADPVSGEWKGEAQIGAPVNRTDTISFRLELAADGSVTGSASMQGETISITGGRYDAASGTLRFSITDPDGMQWSFEGTIKGDTLEGQATSAQAPMTVKVTARRESSSGGVASSGDAAAKQDGAKKDDAKKDEAKKPKVEPFAIDFEGFEQRAIQLPIAAGAFGSLAVNHKGDLLYGRRAKGLDGNASGIFLFSLTDDDKKEQSVASGGAGFAISADGKKILVVQGRGASIADASAGAKLEAVPTKGMSVTVEPRVEWMQLYTDTWRIFRDYFYDPNMHGVDWAAVRAAYAPMIADCASREDVDYVLGELVAELNVGHAYIQGGGNRDSQPQKGVGMLGCDFALENGAYRIARIYGGAAWDSDARGPLAEAGVDVKVGDYLLAVDRLPVDVKLDPWAAFVDRAGRTVMLTVSSEPAMNEKAREVLVRTIGSDSSLRYRAGIEARRRWVEEQSGGKVGYIYVPNTGVDGQTDLFRQFYGQAHLPALLIDERWNGGGQIPTRFIELLGRKQTNAWAVRAGRDWQWPPDAHFGPKAMLINGLAGSGGDAFPHYFRQAGLGKLIGARTWGGLVGISGNPSLIDGGSIRVPTFAFYENDGTWGIEGHGVDPDFPVWDDPAAFARGIDPQLDFAVKHLLAELERAPHRKPARPAYPNRRGMGLPDSDK
ncbi:MAG: PD40 domain-containing protein [Planctomycetes bacterium]|nr:PD40 domain-containing protein [Planctomycetota bacterium]